MQRALHDYIDDQHGSITMEFMVTVPLLFLWLIGSFVMFDAFWSNSQAEKATQTVGDLVSRIDKVTDPLLDEYYLVYAAMTPRAHGERVLRVSSIAYEDDAFVLKWSDVRSAGSTGIQALDESQLPIDILPDIPPLDSVLLVETFTGYQPLAEVFWVRRATRLNAVTIRPRFVREVTDGRASAGTGT